MVLLQFRKTGSGLGLGSGGRWRRCPLVISGVSGEGRVKGGRDLTGLPVAILLKARAAVPRRPRQERRNRRHGQCKAAGGAPGASRVAHRAGGEDEAFAA